jgi:aquaporin Z
MLLLKAVLVEFIGTFFFLSVILNAVANATLGPIAVAVGLLAAIYFGGAISGGHFNPAVSLMMFVKGNIKPDVFILYILSQIVGALVALALNNFLVA